MAKGYLLTLVRMLLKFVNNKIKKMAKSKTNLWVVGIGSALVVGGILYFFLRSRTKQLEAEQQLGQTQAELDAEKKQAFLNRQFANLSSEQKKKATQPIANALAGLGLMPMGMLGKPKAGDTLLQSTVKKTSAV